MKKILLLIILVSIAGTTFSQDTESTMILTKEDYLKKSKSQRNAGIALAVTGVGLAVIGGAVWMEGFSTGFNWIEPSSGGEEMGTGEALFVLGAVTTLCSVPCFIAAAKNKRKALAISMEMKYTPVLKTIGVSNVSSPTLTLKIPL